MGVFEKLKNALFEEEIVEVEEKPKKPKEKSKLDLFKEKKQEKPIAKKVILPEKKEVKVEELDETDYVDEDFEISPAIKEQLEESYKEETQKEQFDVTDEDLRVEEDFPEDIPEPEIVKVLDYDKKEELPEVKEEPKYYQSKPVEKHPYGMSSNRTTYSEYSGGAYEKKDARTHFTPSPIISPIYGILDKNYRKEDVVQKKEVRLTSSYSRSNLNLDDVRKKAYGTSIKEDLEREFMDDTKPEIKESFKVEKEEDVNLLVDLSEDEKPSVKELTMGDALEYFHDLGLEYNVDYVDASNSVGRRVKDNYDEEVEPVNTRLSRLDEERVEEETAPAVEEKKDDMDSDNLFDLIDSMYKDNE